MSTLVNQNRNLSGDTHDNISGTTSTDIAGTPTSLNNISQAGLERIEQNVDNITLQGLTQSQILKRYRISKATLQNWLKNAIPGAVYPDKSYNAQMFDDYVASHAKLTKRANKKTASHIEVPKELFTYLENSSWVDGFTKYVETHGSTTTIENLIALMAKRTEGRTNFSTLKAIDNTNNTIFPILAPRLAELSSIIPETEIYAFSVAYQIALGAGQKSESGAYYTPRHIVVNSLAQIVKQAFEHKEPDFMRQAKVLEPCCGGGFFVVEYALMYYKAYGAWPDKLLYINDIDKNAVEITRYTLTLLAHLTNFDNNSNSNITAKQIEVFSSTLDGTQLPINGFMDIVITNPPYGLKSQYKGLDSTESFSHFIHAGLQKYLKPKGLLLYILPESILFIGKHKEIRQFVLDNYTLREIVYYGQAFTGVMSHIVALLVENSQSTPTSKIELLENNTTSYVLQSDTTKQDYIISKPGSQLVDLELYDQIPHKTLLSSKFALGIVTGNNKQFLSKTRTPGSVLILSGKEVDKGTLLYHSPEVHYLIGSLAACQQKPADMSVFKEKKIVYRFISKDIVSAVDDTEAYTLNSANLIVPDKSLGLSHEYISALLNSDIMNQIFKAKFNSPIKVLKNQLSQLPLFILSDTQRTQIEANYKAGKHTENDTYIKAAVAAEVEKIKKAKSKT